MGLIPLSCEQTVISVVSSKNQSRPWMRDPDGITKFEFPMVPPAIKFPEEASVWTARYKLKDVVQKLFFKYF